MNPDPWTNEEDDANATPETGVADAIAQPETQKPDVAADPAIPTLVLPKPQIAATETTETKTEPDEKPAKSEFPDDYGKCLKIAAEMQGAARLSDEATPAQKAAHKKYLRLQAHIHRIQQGTPIVHVDASKHTAFVGVHNLGLSETKLRYKARADRDIKNLLEERNALKEENAKIKAANESLVGQINELQARLKK